MEYLGSFGTGFFSVIGLTITVSLAVVIFFLIMYVCYEKIGPPIGPILSLVIAGLLGGVLFRRRVEILLIVIIFIASFLLFSFLTYCACKDDKEYMEDRENSSIRRVVSIVRYYIDIIILYSILVTTGICIILSFIMMHNYETIGNEIEEITVYEIETLNDSNTTNGSFFLGIGNFNSDLKYYVMVKEKEGVILKEINSKNTIVVEDSNEVPRYVERIAYNVMKKKDNALSRLWAYSSQYEDIKNEFADREYVLYIPEGSIKQGYSIDFN